MKNCLFQCPHCGKRIRPAVPGELKRHLKSAHLDKWMTDMPGQEPHKCDECGYVSIPALKKRLYSIRQETHVLSKMKRHRDEVHDRAGQLMQCPECGEEVLK